MHRLWKTVYFAAVSAVWCLVRDESVHFTVFGSGMIWVTVHWIQTFVASTLARDATVEWTLPTRTIARSVFVTSTRRRPSTVEYGPLYYCRHNARDRSAKVGNEIKYSIIDYCTCESVLFVVSSPVWSEHSALGRSVERIELFNKNNCICCERAVRSKP